LAVGDPLNESKDGRFNVEEFHGIQAKRHNLVNAARPGEPLSKAALASVRVIH
jgi:hypothetical protein